MAFLRRADYSKQIRSEILSVVTSDDDSIRKDAELAAQAEIESYLRHRYDMAKTFRDLPTYEATVSYTTGDLIAFPDNEDDIYSLNADTNGDPQTISGVSPIDDPTQWTKGDTRNQLVRMHLVDMTLYHLHSRINPRNIPEFRIARRDDCINWLKMVAAGKLTTALPVIEPIEDNIGLNTKWNSNEKFNHSF